MPYGDKRFSHPALALRASTLNPTYFSRILSALTHSNRLRWRLAADVWGTIMRELSVAPRSVVVFGLYEQTIRSIR